VTKLRPAEEPTKTGAAANSRPPALETLVESADLGLEIFHPGGLEITNQLADLCHIGRGSSVLDVASGTGASACFLAAHKGARVIGIDASDSMVERAKKRAACRGLHVEFRRGDAHALPFEDGVFDAVVSECTTCLLDKTIAIREMVRVAKDGGIVGIHDICWKTETPEATKERLAAIEGERPETLDGWIALFEQAGLLDVRGIDRSDLIPVWLKGIRKQLGFAGQLRIFLKVIRTWGVPGLARTLASTRIFESRYTGYGIVVGRKRAPAVGP
jgi:SAM-dependent methyltransferase